MKKKSKLNKAEKRHIRILSGILLPMDPEYGGQQPLNYYDYELLYGDIDINNDEHRILVIQKFLIPSLKKKPKRGLDITKYVLLLAIKFSDSTEVADEFEYVEAIPLDRAVKDKGGFLELIYKELFDEDPSITEYNPNFFPY